MNLCALGPFLFVSHFAGHLITCSPLLPFSVTGYHWIQLGVGGPLEGVGLETHVKLTAYITKYRTQKFMYITNVPVFIWRMILIALFMDLGRIKIITSRAS
jgi:hypothetical protein